MIAITGASGFVGSHLLYNLISQGLHVRAIVRNKAVAQNKIEQVFKFYNDSLKNYLLLIDWAEADVMEPIELLGAFDGVSQLYHCAGFVSFNPAQRKELWLVNVQGTRNVINAALSKKVQKMCFLSSIAALGSSTVLPIDEETHWKPDDRHSLYSKAKYEAEQEAWRGIAEGLPTVIINAGVILGPGVWGDSSTALFTAVDKGMSYYTSGTTGYVDVRDVAAIMVASMNHAICNESFIVVSENRSIKDLFCSIADGLHKARPTKQATYFLLRIVAYWEALRYLVTSQPPRVTQSSARTATSFSAYSHKKIIDLLNYKFFSFEESIRFTCDCFLKSK